jgi:hypothetical protein
MGIGAAVARAKQQNGRMKLFSGQSSSKRVETIGRRAYLRFDTAL